jgi:CRISPR locus-related DNA-binding protein
MDVSIIATIYSYEPVIASVTKFGANNLFLLVDDNPDEKQKEAIKTVKDTIGKYIHIELIKTDVYDIVQVAEDSVKLIDKIAPKSKILLNVSASRKTKAFGLMFAGYARYNKVDKISYITKETNTVVVLPKMSFNLNKSQHKLLSYLKKYHVRDPSAKIYHELNISKSMFYKTLNEIKSMGFVDGDNITDAGKIALL